MNKKEWLDKLAAENAQSLADIAEREANPREYWQVPDTETEEEFVTKDIGDVMLTRRQDNALVSTDEELLDTPITLRVLEHVLGIAAEEGGNHTRELCDRLTRRIENLQGQIRDLKAKLYGE